jgi:hypothetical protein
LIGWRDALMEIIVARQVVDEPRIQRVGEHKALVLSPQQLTNIRDFLVYTSIRGKLVRLRGGVRRSVSTGRINAISLFEDEQKCCDESS